MADFAISIKKILRHEGVVWDEAGNVVATGYCDVPGDNGGETNFGITIKNAREAGYEGGMEYMTPEFAVSFYHREYWSQLWGDMIDDQRIADELFDTAVNCGKGTAVRFLQRVMNVLNENETLWDDVTADGVMGGTTVCTLNQAIKSRPYMATCILRLIDNLQGVRYVELSEHNPKYEKFMPGWTRVRVGVEKY